MLLLIGIFLFFISMILHEYFHTIFNKSRIQFYLYKGWIPALRVVGATFTDLDLALGGLGSGSIFLIFSLLSTNYEYFSIMIIVASIQLYYGIFELMFYRKLSKNQFMKYHYILYITVAIIMGSIFFVLKIFLRFFLRVQ